MTQAGLSWRDLQATPPRILYALLDYLAQRGHYAAKPKASVLDTSVPPDEFAKMFQRA